VGAWARIEFCAWRCEISISGIAVTLAYGDNTLSHNIYAAFGRLDIAFEKMVKIVMVQQRFELLCDITANIIVRVLNFGGEFFAAIDDEEMSSISRLPKRSLLPRPRYASSFVATNNSGVRRLIFSASVREQVAAVSMPLAYQRLLKRECFHRRA
jgi:hypothetical protein